MDTFSARAECAKVLQCCLELGDMFTHKIYSESDFCCMLDFNKDLYRGQDLWQIEAINNFCGQINSLKNSDYPV